MILLDILFYSLAFIVAVLGGYLFLITVCAFLYKPQSKERSQLPKVIVLVPCHNEEYHIFNAISRIMASQYPDDKFSVVALADNCKDSTAKRAKDAGAIVIERSDSKNHGKGQALNWFFTQQKKVYEHYDVLVLVDADSLLDPLFLQSIAKSFSSEEVNVVQGFHGVCNPKDSWRTALASAAFSIKHHVRPSGRNFLGGTAGLNGNGMAFRTTVVRDLGWPAHSIAEDIEMTTMLLVHGHKVYYNPQACVYATMESSVVSAKGQRERWEHGRAYVSRDYGRKLMNQFMKTREFACLDELWELKMPPLSIFGLLVIALFVWSYFAYTAFIFIPTFIILTLIFHIFSGLLLRREPYFVWLALLASPLFVLWRIPITARIYLGKASHYWLRTFRSNELSKSERDK